MLVEDFRFGLSPVGAFNVNNLEQIQGILEAARETRSLVILQASRKARPYVGNGFLRHLLQKQAPTREEADRLFDKQVQSILARLDANDMLYQFDASRDYDPAPRLEAIQAPLLAINSADDQVNPPELGILERQIKKVKRGRFVLLPITEQTRGHGTHSWPAVWKEHLLALLRETQ